MVVAHYKLKGENIMTNLDDIISIDEVCSILKMSKRSIYDWCKKGIIPAFKIGNTWRFSSRDLDDWIEKKKVLNYK
tara:strand:+ start:676 stop:903 length:228 start_codon:yes stop_codon:yes gene_type:complete